jgi:hypothetical protein
MNRSGRCKIPGQVRDRVPTRQTIRRRWTDYNHTGLCFLRKELPAQERKKHNENGLPLCALCGLLWLSSVVAASAALGPSGVELCFLGSDLRAGVEWLGCCYGSESVHDGMVRLTPARRVSRAADDEMLLAINL